MVIENQNLRTSLGVRLDLTPLLARRSRAAQADRATKFDFVAAAWNTPITSLPLPVSPALGNV